MAGSREKGWGKEKVFREGQAHQRLDDLVFTYVDTIAKLRPKVAILENVKGILAGNAKAYTKELVKRLREHGYTVQVFLLNAATMGVPQMRERVFFIARQDASWPNLRLEFKEPPIPFGKVRIGVGRPNSEHDMGYWNRRIKSDRAFDDISMRLDGRATNWNTKILHDDKVSNTIVSASGTKLIHYDTPHHLSDTSLCGIQTYPQDYNFGDMEAKYLIGMSVPPVMTAQISHQINVQWFSHQPTKQP
jgi:DNA (cytosine-5)-methyltransferase 1